MLNIVVVHLKQLLLSYWLSPACHPGSVFGQGSSFVEVRTNHHNKVGPRPQVGEGGDASMNYFILR